MDKTQNTPVEKDWWDKAKIVAALATPIVIAVFGYFIDSTLKNMEIRVRYVEIAVTILREKPDQEAKALRSWAVDVLSSYSPIPLSNEAIDELKEGPLPGHAYLKDHEGNFITDHKGNRIIAK